MNTITFVGEHTTNYEVREHHHTVWELVYCTSGNGWFTFADGSQISYQAGMAVAIPANALHTNTTDIGFSNIHIHICDPSFTYRTPFKVTDDPGGYLKLAFQQTRYYFHADIPSCELILSALAELIANYMEVYRNHAEFSEAVRVIRSQILLHYAETNFALDEFIKTLPFHYDYLRKLFKKEIGITPLEYMTRMRMKQAKSLLTMHGSSAYSIAEIAELCGFEDALYFSRVFKKYYGSSPSVFSGRK